MQSTSFRHILPCLIAGAFFLSACASDRVVNEAFPTSAPRATSVPAVAATATMPATPSATAPAVPTATAVIAAATATAAEIATAVPAATEDPAMAGEALQQNPAQPLQLGAGDFTKVDETHWATGQAIIYKLADGQRVLRLENFKAAAGPDLYVHLSGHARPRSRAELHGAGDIELSQLKGNIGEQNYVLPAELDLAAFKSVVIYCKRFSVVFSTAELSGG
jgi:Electron transfer DM13